MIKRKLMILSPFLFWSMSSFGILPVGQTPPSLTLEKETGGHVKGDAAWSSSSVKGKVSVIFYVAPGEKDLNKQISDAIKAENFSRDHFQSYAIVNMAASAWPNFMIEKKLKQSQEEFPNTIYIKDKKKVLVDQWKLADNSNDIVILNKEGKVIYSFDGKVAEQDISKIVKTIKESLK